MNKISINSNSPTLYLGVRSVKRQSAKRNKSMLIASFFIKAKILKNTNIQWGNKL
jgi:hypothetical protein